LDKSYFTFNCFYDAIRWFQFHSEYGFLIVWATS